MSIVAFSRDALTRAHGTGAFDLDRIVVGVDFTSASLAAGRWATTALAPNAHAVLVHAASPSAGDSSKETDSSSRDDHAPRNAAALAGGLTGFAATLDVASASTVVRVGLPSRWLGAMAQEAGASLIVLGRRADSARRRVGEPNVLERVARRSASSVLVVPEGTVGLPRQVLAAVDNGPLSGAVIAAADRVARLHDIPLIVMHVVPPASGAYERVIDAGRRTGRRSMRSRHEDVAATMSPEATAWLEQLVRVHSTTRVHRIHVELGDPARQIASMSTKLGPTLVVSGKRGEDGAPLGSLGSVARTLLKSAPGPVLAIDQDATHMDGGRQPTWDVPRR